MYILCLIDVLSKSEPNLSRRRSNRQNPSPKSDNHTDSDISGSKEDVKDILTEKGDESPKPGNILMIKEEPVTLPTLEVKESSKEDNVKKWIEDSNMIMSHTDTKNQLEVDVKDELLAEDALESEEKGNIKRGRKLKAKRQDSNDTKSEKRRRKPKDEGDESDSENETKPIHEAVKETPQTVSEEVCDKVNNNILPTEKDDEKPPHLPSSEQTSIDALSAFCNIIGNVPKLQSHESIDSNNSSILDNKSNEASNEAPTPTKDLHERRKSKGERQKRRRTHSTNEDVALTSPKEKKEKQSSPPLEYNPDFLSDLGVFYFFCY